MLAAQAADSLSEQTRLELRKLELAVETEQRRGTAEVDQRRLAVELQQRRLEADADERHLRLEERHLEYVLERENEQAASAAAAAADKRAAAAAVADERAFKQKFLKLKRKYNFQCLD